MEKSLNPFVTPTCPYIGLKNDPSVFFSYPSNGNQCYHCRPPAVPLQAHQQAYCLGASHADCPVYQQTGKKPLPSEFRAGEGPRVQRFGLTGKLLAFFIGILLLGMVGLQFFRQNVITPPMMTPSQTIPTAIPPSATIIPPTNSPAPTSTFVPTTTIVPQVHALEVPINVDDHKFLIHRVGVGETFEILAKTYTTTPEVIRSINYSMKPSLWANSVIVISPGLQTVDLALPAFKTYQVTAQAIMIDELAGKLTVDPTLLRLYNACNDNCRLSAGDWLILPISK